MKQNYIELNKLEAVSTLDYSTVITIHRIKQKLKYIGLKWIEYVILCAIYDIEKCPTKHSYSSTKSEYLITLLNLDKSLVYKCVKDLIAKGYLFKEGEDLVYQEKRYILSGKSRMLMNLIKTGEDFTQFQI